jgi:hypothetical protein
MTNVRTNLAGCTRASVESLACHALVWYGGGRAIKANPRLRRGLGISGERVRRPAGSGCCDCRPSVGACDFKRGIMPSDIPPIGASPRCECMRYPPCECGSQAASPRPPRHRWKLHAADGMPPRAVPNDKTPPRVTSEDRAPPRPVYESVCVAEPALALEEGNHVATQ